MNSTNDCVRRKPRAGSRRGDDQERVADLGIGHAVKLAGIVERDDGIDAAAPHHVAGERERRGRLEHHVAERDGPGETFRVRARKARPLELDAHHLALARTRNGGATDGAAAGIEQRPQVDRRGGVEDEPDRVVTAEHRGRDRHRERERQPDRLALMLELDRDRGGRIARDGRFRGFVGSGGLSAARGGGAAATGGFAGAMEGPG